MFAAGIYRQLRHRLEQEEVAAIIRGAVDAEIEFINDAVPCSLIGMNPALMAQYVRFVADRLLHDLGHSKIFNCTNPFPWMESIGLEGKTNFFEATVSEYSRANESADAFATDAAF